MMYLKIEQGKGYYLITEPDNIWIEIGKINKDDLLALLKKAIGEDFEMQEYDEKILSNKAHQIIYKNLYEKFSELALNRSRFKSESETLYKVALEKYAEQPNKNIDITS